MNATKRKLRRLSRELLETRKRADQAEREARTDDLTGLWNKRAWRESIERCIGLESTFSVVLFDLANLKAANSALGHEHADALLRDVAGCVRYGDSIGYRIGGDEFAILLPGVDEACACAVRDRVEAAVGIRVLAPGVTVFLAGDVLSWAPGSPTITALLTMADLALERRKAARKAALGLPLSRV